MLVLGRLKDERIVIADGLITITVVEIRGEKVRLGIEAPADISVHREEVFEAIKREGPKKYNGGQGHSSQRVAVCEDAPGGCSPG